MEQLADENSDFFIFKDRAQRPWVNVKALAMEMGVDAGRVRKAIADLQG